MNIQETVNKIIAICGDSASGKSVLANFLADKLGDATILECDRYHKWKRYDPHWLQYTQLNPGANDLALLEQDIKSLKNGEIICRREYDHAFGEFTEPTEIRPNKYIIVCGLHTFMVPHDLYDLKIFIDTNPTLKRQWKIARDTTVRSYTLKQITDQIKQREPDYEQFIRPQMMDADMIVNFYHMYGLNIYVRKGFGFPSSPCDKAEFDIFNITTNHYDYIFDMILKCMMKN